MTEQEPTITLTTEQFEQLLEMAGAGNNVSQWTLIAVVRHELHHAIDAAMIGVAQMSRDPTTRSSIPAKEGLDKISQCLDICRNVLERCRRANGYARPEWREASNSLKVVTDTARLLRDYLTNRNCVLEIAHDSTSAEVRVPARVLGVMISAVLAYCLREGATQIRFKMDMIDNHGSGMSLRIANAHCITVITDRPVIPLEFAETLLGGASTSSDGEADHGLAVARILARGHGGELEFCHDPHTQHLTLRITLPVPNG